jgi:hypothetical protein
MARAYAARLGCIAMSFDLFKHVLAGQSFGQGLWHAVGCLIGFSIVGWFLGSLTESLIRQSMEANFREKVEKHYRRPKSESTATP